VEATKNEAGHLLSKLFDAERSVRKFHAEVAAVDHARLIEAASAAVDDAMTQADREEMALRLVRLSDVLADLHGPKVVALLIRILGCEEPEARHSAGEALEGLAFDRFKEVALGIERAIETLPSGSPSLSELPYLLAEVPEPGVLRLLGLFLKHQDAEAVAAAIEALVEYGEPAGAGLLTALLGDKREVQLEDDLGDEGKITVGELATEARDFLVELERGGKKTVDRS
jgi:hypothetical protein